MRHDTRHPHLPRRFGDRGGRALPAPSTSTTAAAGNDDLPGRNDGNGRHSVSGPSAPASSSAAARSG